MLLLLNVILCCFILQYTLIVVVVCDQLGLERSRGLLPVFGELLLVGVHHIASYVTRSVLMVLVGDSNLVV